MKILIFVLIYVSLKPATYCQSIQITGLFHTILNKRNFIQTFLSQQVVEAYQKFFAKPLTGDSLERFLQNIYFECYEGASVDKPVIVNFKEASSQLPGTCIRDPNKTVVFFMYGWSPNIPKAESIIEILISALVTRPELTVIYINFANLVTSLPDCSTETGSPIQLVVCNARSYWGSVNNVSIIAEKLADEIFVPMINANTLPLQKTRIIGLSLGAQCMFQLAEHIHRKIDRKLPWLTALEPAWPLYFSLKQFSYKNYAGYLDVIHTNPGIAGTPYKLGHVDFFVNFPRLLQPACGGIAPFLQLNKTGILCSHVRSIVLYAESVLHPDDFQACCNPLPFCNTRKHPVLMGYGLKYKEERGTCFLKTNTNAPFGKGAAGARIL